MLAIATKEKSSFRELRVLKEENEKLRRALEERKLIERAKGILMKKEDIHEDEAYSRIRKLSMDRRKKMAEIAEAVIIAEEART